MLFLHGLDQRLRLHPRTASSLIVAAIASISWSFFSLMRDPRATAVWQPGISSERFDNSASRLPLVNLYAILGGTGHIGKQVVSTLCQE
jgi:hypothetical protein